MFRSYWLSTPLNHRALGWPHWLAIGTPGRTGTFTVPGARVDVNGRYTLSTEALDFHGTVRLEAKLSDMTTGSSRPFSKLVDPLVRQKDVTVIPVTIRGTENPRVGVDIRRALTPD